jgi:hypothetical protein
MFSKKKVCVKTELKKAVHAKTFKQIILPVITLVTFAKFCMRRWCSGNMQPFQGCASGSITARDSRTAQIDLFWIAVCLPQFYLR